MDDIIKKILKKNPGLTVIYGHAEFFFPIIEVEILAEEICRQKGAIIGLDFFHIFGQIKVPKRTFKT